MKIRTSYKKDSDGDIEAIITVTDCDDFTTCNIFNEADNYPSHKSYVFGEQARNWDSQFFKTCADALNWTHLQIACIESMLNMWRAKAVPEAEDFRL